MLDASPFYALNVGKGHVLSMLESNQQLSPTEHILLQIIVQRFEHGLHVTHLVTSPCNLAINNSMV